MRRIAVKYRGVDEGWADIKGAEIVNRWGNIDPCVWGKIMAQIRDDQAEEGAVLDNSLETYLWRTLGAVSCTELVAPTCMSEYELFQYVREMLACCVRSADTDDCRSAITAFDKIYTGRGWEMLR